METVRGFNNELMSMLLAGGVAVIPTDTLYGIVGSALRPETVERIYRLRKRNTKKPVIVLLSSVEDLSLFGVRLSKEKKTIIERFWPGKVSVIFSVTSKKFAYLHRGTGGIAFRMPALKDLRAFLAKTGPLIAPSANIEGMSPALTIKKAMHYFGSGVDYYVNAGKKISKPSTLICFKSKKIEVLREGAV